MEGRYGHALECGFKQVTRLTNETNKRAAVPNVIRERGGGHRYFSEKKLTMPHRADRAATSLKLFDERPIRGLTDKTAIIKP